MTLSSLEDAVNQVEAALDDGRSEFQSISDARSELMMLQQQVEEAHARLHKTQARVETNVKRLTELKAEAAEIARVNNLASVPARAVDTRVSMASEASTSAAKAMVPARAPTTRKSRGLASSMALEPGLRNFWYAVAFMSKLSADTLIPFELFGEPWVLFRDASGAAACVRDQCAHRACPLSLGSVQDGAVTCPYHGWRFNGAGECVEMPSTVQCPGVAVASLPVAERDGFIWVWPGEAAPVEVPTVTPPPEGFTLHAEIEVEVPVEHGLLMENLLDLAHAPFTHTSTFARGWPVPDAVRFQTQRLLGGHWQPYPIDMSFEPPCMVVSLIGLAQPGRIERGARASECRKHLHQLHVCLPSRRGHTRLLYRMSLDFLPWIRHIPGITAFWKHIAGQVLGEDLVLVTGQQDRLEAGGDTWSHPVSYDKLAVRYRRWRNELGAGGAVKPEHRRGAAADAGQLFASDDDSDAALYVDRGVPAA